MRRTIDKPDTPSRRRFLAAAGATTLMPAAVAGQDRADVATDSDRQPGPFVAGPGAVPRTVEAKLRDGFVSVADFGAMGDGSTDDASALLRALQASPRVYFPDTSDGYAIKTHISHALTRDTIIDFNGQRLIFDGGRIVLTGQLLAQGRRLTAAASRYATQVRLDRVDEAAAGDLVYISTAQAPSPEWSDTKKDLIRIRSVDSRRNVLTLDEGLNFAYRTDDRGMDVLLYRPVALTLVRPHLDLIAQDGDTATFVMIRCEGLRDVRLIEPVIAGRHPFDRQANIGRNGIWLYRCWNWSIEGPRYEAMSYAVGVYGGSRNGRETDVCARYMHHAHADVGDWSAGYLLDGLVSSDGWISISTHPCFRAHIQNARVHGDYGLSNMRCIGGSLKNSSIRNTGEPEAAQFQSVALHAEFGYLYEDADFELDAVAFDMPRFVDQAPFSVKYGRRVRVSNMTGFAVGAGQNYGDVRQVIFGSGNVFATSPSGLGVSKYGVRAPVRVDRPPLLPAYFEGQTHRINPMRSLVDQTDDYLRCYGPVYVRQRSGQAKEIGLRIYCNAFAAVEQADAVIGTLTLRGTAHDVSGGFDTVEEKVSFLFRVASPSALDFRSEDVNRRAVAGSDLSLTIGGPPGGNGETQLGRGGEHHIEFLVTLMSRRPGSIYSLTYDLELVRV